MVLQQLTHGGLLLRNLHADEADDAWIRQPMHKWELTEVLVVMSTRPSSFASASSALSVARGAVSLAEWTS